MCTVAYEKMDVGVENVSIFRRLQKVDFRVWFFMFVIGSIAFDVTKLEYLVQYGLVRHTIHIPICLIFNGIPLYASVSNNLSVFSFIKAYSTFFLLVSTIIATLGPIWIIFEFNTGAPEQIRLVMEHGDTHEMEFIQRLGYCILFELTLILDAGFYAIQMFLARSVIRVIKSEKKDAPVEMNAFNVV
ncbi:uncharacterized protein CELE_T16G12.13 [Caenorhabditis elegans]|uniref:Uncharacterized protein n=1 Tax=Caenorhabditis elegans TaxID=6239 RepID=A0A679L8L4_CAEEL|nr:Uncharacterized protein CELE_T16G12.13 [Caenorhabditis elegans]CAA9991439.1 Uncharacterized protein CELE_T16G12.13 [Caenorhabditis elegans]